jgi:hypothetical protein
MKYLPENIKQPTIKQYLNVGWLLQDVLHQGNRIQFDFLYYLSTGALNTITLAIFIFLAWVNIFPQELILWNNLIWSKLPKD